MIHPYDDRIEFITEVYKTDYPRQITIDEIRIIQRRIGNTNTNNKKKRIRENGIE